MSEEAQHQRRLGVSTAPPPYEICAVCAERQADRRDVIDGRLYLVCVECCGDGTQFIERVTGGSQGKAASNAARMAARQVRDENTALRAKILAVVTETPGLRSNEIRARMGMDEDAGRIDTCIRRLVVLGQISRHGGGAVGRGFLYFPKEKADE